MLKTAPLQIRAYEHLREMIEENQLEDGVIYSETRLAKEIGVSRAPPCGTRCKSWNRRG